jgi:hypothetical protein
MKGQGLMDAIIGAVIFTLAVSVISVYSFQYSIRKSVDLQYQLDSSQSTLLALLSVTDSNNVPFIELLGNHIDFPSKDISALGGVLDKFVFQDKCYKLSDATGTLLKNGNNCNFQYKSSTKIPLPYNTDPTKLVDWIELERS